MKRSRLIESYLRRSEPEEPRRHWLSSALLWAIGIWAALTPIMVACFVVRWLVAKIVPLSF
jgi:hypothetical protein